MKRFFAATCGLVFVLCALVAYGYARAEGSATVWLCQPGAADDPCASSLKATVVAEDGSLSTLDPKPATASSFDCFYVYPTVSREPTPNADLRVQRAERDIARAQAAPFSQVCRVWAPIYRQRTLSALLHPNDATDAIVTAYQSLLQGWRAYLAQSHGRPFVLIGHSQGAAMLVRLLRTEIAPNAALRARLVSAIVLGGNVTLGSLNGLPTCRSALTAGCIIAYSSFADPPPSDSFFGIAWQGVDPRELLPAQADVRVVCTNPAALGATGDAALDAWFPTSTQRQNGVNASTPWTVYRGLFAAQCRQTGNATWLQITRTAAAANVRPRLLALGPRWGLHADDVNLALGSLVDDVRVQEAVYAMPHGSKVR